MATMEQIRSHRPQQRHDRSEKNLFCVSQHFFLVISLSLLRTVFLNTMTRQYRASPVREATREKAPILAYNKIYPICYNVLYIVEHVCV